MGGPERGLVVRDSRLLVRAIVNSPAGQRA